jgi:hypothetical protein
MLMSIHHVMMFNKWYVNVVNYKNLNFYLFMYVQPLGTPFQVNFEDMSEFM